MKFQNLECQQKKFGWWHLSLLESVGLLNLQKGTKNAKYLFVDILKMCKHVTMINLLMESASAIWRIYLKTLQKQ